ncbi:hypothetical protein [Pseudonocardia spinosispora]|uniref:hypothetical protein n=1 Tax=Pseudonocardia spinosispora TaxID=103441 RepID=UPI000424D70A|nr:hypothetical protein [Pseudonocardia spinosispora]
MTTPARCGGGVVPLSLHDQHGVVADFSREISHQAVVIKETPTPRILWSHRAMCTAAQTGEAGEAGG